MNRVRAKETLGRRVGLALGHVLLAPMTAFWLSLLIVFLGVLVVPRLRPDVFDPWSGITSSSPWDIQYARAAAGIGYVVYTFGIPLFPPFLASLATGYGLWRPLRWGRPAAAVLALSSCLAILNALFWQSLYAYQQGYFLTGYWEGWAMLRFLTALGFPSLVWYGYVLWSLGTSSGREGGHFRRAN